MIKVRVERYIMDATKNWFPKPKLTLRLKKNVIKYRLCNIDEVVQGVDVSIEGGLNVKPLINPLVEISLTPTQFQEENLLPKLSKK